MEKRENCIMRLAAMLLCLTLISFYLMCGMYARYTSQGSGSDSARVAAFVFNVSSTPDTNSIPIEQIKKPGDSSTYSIIIKNYSSSRTSEVAESYVIKASINGSMPLSCTVTDDSTRNQVIQINNTNNTGTQIERASSEQTFSASVPNYHSYKLKVEWPAEKNDASYANSSGQGEIVLTVTGQQAD